MSRAARRPAIALLLAPLLALALGPLLAACDDEMSHQPRYDSYEPSELFADGKSLQAPPEGTVARDEPARQAALDQRPAMSAGLLARGRERFGIYCTPCHGYAGYGGGTVPTRGFPRPPSLHEARLREAPSSYFVDVITHGHGVMYSYADRVSPADRWAIAAYIRALQLSQNAPLASLTPDERRRLGGGS
ncbi:cytochrome c [Ancylobacter sp. MQZ15Z-1]|uniref:Cytochrome c n=1 Tax=Ancylobacter mangrovi TaxID=2972472 RepID=A0A9X2P843_9HYPH|nr:cytochrome c [Ancylobacter mangrovi]MCS0493992.1 cytochrome c [Ancylobacter mangrovi]